MYNPAEVNRVEPFNQMDWIISMPNGTTATMERWIFESGEGEYENLCKWLDIYINKSIPPADMLQPVKEALAHMGFTLAGKNWKELLKRAAFALEFVGGNISSYPEEWDDAKTANDKD